MPESTSPRYWFVIPAAGVGSRMNADKPKQYLKLLDKTILEHTLHRILSFPNLAGIVVAISDCDDYWKSLSVSRHPLVHTVKGGEERAHSVLNGLDYLADKISADDWVLVHDAARPCVTLLSIKTLCDDLLENRVGGILAVPVSDTLKQITNKKEIHATIDRRGLWQAQTPQAFRYKLLRDCLSNAVSTNKSITDESSALELFGYVPQVIQGRTDNIKITRPDDLLMAEFILKQQEKNL